MERTYVSDVKNKLGTEVKVQGFLENIRNGSAMAFLVLKDITGKLQITVEKEKHPQGVPSIKQVLPAETQKEYG